MSAPTQRDETSDLRRRCALGWLTGAVAASGLARIGCGGGGGDDTSTASSGGPSGGSSGGSSTLAEAAQGLGERRAEIGRLRQELDAQDTDRERLARECAASWARGECPDQDLFAATAPRSLGAARQ